VGGLGRVRDSLGTPFGRLWTFGCPWDVLGTSSGCSWDINGCLWDVLGMSVGCPWDVFGMSVECPWNVFGMSVGCPWDVRGMSVGCLWDILGISSGCPRDVRGMSAGCPRDVVGMSLGCVSVPEDITNVIGPDGFPRTLGRPMGCPSAANCVNFGPPKALKSRPTDIFWTFSQGEATGGKNDMGCFLSMRATRFFFSADTLVIPKDICRYHYS
jgi:hypothetical protein